MNPEKISRRGFLKLAPLAVIALAGCRRGSPNLENPWKNVERLPLTPVAFKIPDGEFEIWFPYRGGNVAPPLPDRFLGVFYRNFSDPPGIERELVETGVYRIKVVSRHVHTGMLGLGEEIDRTNQEELEKWGKGEQIMSELELKLRNLPFFLEWVVFDSTFAGEVVTFCLVRMPFKSSGDEILLTRAVVKVSRDDLVDGIEPKEEVAGQVAKVIELRKWDTGTLIQNWLSFRQSSGGIFRVIPRTSEFR